MITFRVSVTGFQGKRADDQESRKWWRFGHMSLTTLYACKDEFEGSISYFHYTATGRSRASLRWQGSCVCDQM